MKNYIKIKTSLPPLLRNETWKDVDGFIGTYQISDFGRLRYLKYNYITIGSGKTGEYKRCPLTDFNGNKHYKRIHQLVAQAFIPNLENKTQVNHKDGNKHNNHKDNLEWNTPQENNQHAKSVLLKIYRKFPTIIINEIRASNLTNKELSKLHGIDYRYIWSIRNGKARTLEY